ncbi:putative restriction endonuclease [Azospira oryzae PS]|uniref:Putative restriction endonuclease n=1 Tax=Azospira oryzae (strain ATCC BAA-33 / DSM 13638 / PS) TaxID=640081 RepID=G8QJD8_AZOOP|nr:HNH endonuclease signature motif containing protein [Azospira oryzae]AEV27607.1 putative restriction endonuclease [Azospira oryzae PS]
MQSPRSRNLDQKPKAQSWINANPGRSSLLLEAIRALEVGYGGDLSGFVDFAPAEYRFNSKKSGGYVILRARNNGSVGAKVQLRSNYWKELELKNPRNLSTLTQLITKHCLTGFDFENEHSQVEFDKAVKKALDSPESERKERLKNASPEPRKVWRKVSAYVRNPDVVAEVLHRARGSCEECREAAPFVRISNGTPYLEVHHRKQLSDGGYDTVENAVALCPNCHRKKHFG